MSTLDNFLGLLAPHMCLGCGVEGSLLCDFCRAALPLVPSRCYRCRSLTVDNRTCVACRRTSPLAAVSVATIYAASAKDLVWQLKFAGAQAAARILASRMAPGVAISGSRTLIVPVPTTANRARQRGYDQAKLLARELARQTGAPYFNCLARTGHARQVGAGRQQRLRQLQEAFRATRPVPPAADIVLVDDVVTTGATLEAAAKTLKLAGARRIRAVVFAQP